MGLQCNITVMYIISIGSSYGQAVMHVDVCRMYMMKGTYMNKVSRCPQLEQSRHRSLVVGPTLQLLIYGEERIKRVCLSGEI